MEVSEKMRAYLLEMTELARKHGYFITGCGCCGSPEIRAMPDDFREGHYIASMYDNEGFIWRGYDDGETAEDLEWFWNKDSRAGGDGMID